MSTTLPPTYRRAAAAILLSLLPLAAGGCEGNQSPDKILSDTFHETTPSEAARMANNDFDADKRREGISMLSAASWGGEEPYVRMYRFRSDDEDATVRAAAVHAIGLHGTATPHENPVSKVTETDVDVLVRRLRDKATFVRWEAAQALQKIHGDNAAKPLIVAATEDEDSDVRLAAAQALGQYPEPAVFNALVGRLDDSDFGVVQAASESLATLTGQDIGTDPAKWLAFQEAHPKDTFAHQRQYTWVPYAKPRKWYQKMEFWKEAKTPEPQVPRGTDASVMSSAKGL